MQTNVMQPFLHCWGNLLPLSFWEGKPARSLSFFTMLKSKGNIGLPDVVKYNWACHLTQIVDWNVHLHARFGIHPNTGTPRIKPDILLCATLDAFSSACKAVSLYNSYTLTTLGHNPAFPPWCFLSFLAANWPETETKAGDFFRDGIVLDWT